MLLFQQPKLFNKLFTIVLLLPIAVNAAEIQPRGEMTGLEEWAVELQFRPDNLQLACGTYEKVLLWNVLNNELQQTIPKIPGYASSLLYWNNSQQLLIGAYQKIFLYDLTTQKIVKEFKGHRGQVTQLIPFTKDRFLSTSDDGTLRLWERDGNRTELWENEDPITSAVLLPGNKQIAIALGDETRVTRPGELLIFDLQENQLIYRESLHRSATTAVILSNDQKTLLTASFDETIIVTDISEQKPTGIFKEHSRPVNCLAVIPQTSWVISGSGGRFKKKNELKIWQQATGEVAVTGEPHAERICALAVTSDGKILATGSYDETVKLWNLNGFSQPTDDVLQPPKKPEPGSETDNTPPSN